MSHQDKEDVIKFCLPGIDGGFFRPQVGASSCELIVICKAAGITIYICSELWWAERTDVGKALSGVSTTPLGYLGYHR